MFGKCSTEDRASRYIASTEKWDDRIARYSADTFENGGQFEVLLLAAPLLRVTYQRLRFSLSLRLNPSAMPIELHEGEVIGFRQKAEAVLGAPLPADCYIDIDGVEV